MRAIHQLVPSFADHDAIGDHARRLQRVLRRLGYASEIFADWIDPALEGVGVPFGRLLRRPPRGAWYLYQASTNSRMASFVADHADRALVCFHNVTPWQLVVSEEPEVARLLWQARREIGRLADHCHRVLTLSRFNAQDLAQLGFARSRVLPPLVELPPAGPPRQRAGSRWLFVGRIFPSKQQIRLVEALALYRRAYDPGATLMLVGGTASERYATRLRARIGELGLGGAIELRQGLDAGGLARAYAEADVFVSASLHEGFGFPIVEAMAAGLPVVALARAAVPETIANAGVLVRRDHPAALAAAVGLVARDPVLVEALVRAGRRRAEALAPEVVVPQWERALVTMAAEP
jgi:glycosyltransferase involved in cell wall biosynthesis